MSSIVSSFWCWALFLPLWCSFLSGSPVYLLSARVCHLPFILCAQNDSQAKPMLFCRGFFPLYNYSWNSVSSFNVWFKSPFNTEKLSSITCLAIVSSLFRMLLLWNPCHLHLENAAGPWTSLFCLFCFFHLSISILINVLSVLNSPSCWIWICWRLSYTLIYILSLHPLEKL